MRRSDGVALRIADYVKKTGCFIVRLCEKWGVYSMDYVKNWGAMVWIT